MKDVACDDKQTWRIHGAGVAAHQPCKSKFKKCYLLDTVTSHVVHDFLSLNQQMHTNCYVIHSIVGLLKIKIVL
jgi:hypothetical protein